MKIKSIQVLINNEEPEQVVRIKKLYERLLHETAILALTRVCQPDEYLKCHKSLRKISIKDYSKSVYAAEIEFARMWFEENELYQQDIKAERKISFKELCYVLDLPYKELKALILQLIRSINNNIFINNNINIYNNIYLYNKYINNIIL